MGEDMRQFYEALARYTISVLPTEGAERRELRDYASSAQQFGCMALVRMGVAEERPYGCELLYAPEEASAHIREEALWLPDAAHVMLVLAEQFADLRFDRPQKPAPNGAMAEYRIVKKPPEQTDDAPNFLETHYPELFAVAKATMEEAERRAERMVVIPPIYERAAAAKSSPEVLDAFEMIGWVKAGRWTAASEIGLWRMGAVKGFEQTAQFASALAKCIADLPEEVREAIGKIREGPNAEAIDAGISRIRKSLERRRKRTEQNPGEEILRERAVASWQTNAERDLDRYFYTRWRMQTGWDSDEKLLPLFNDRVARAMREAVLVAVQ